MYPSGGQPEKVESATGKLNAYFDGRQPEIMGMIERLVNMDSFSEDGEDVNKVGETVSGWMRDLLVRTALRST